MSFNMDFIKANKWACRCKIVARATDEFELVFKDKDLQEYKLINEPHFP